jgi:hypothetical protein
LIDRRLPNGVRIPVGWTLRRAESLSLLGVNAALRMALKGREDADTTTVDRRRLLRLPPFVRRWRMRQIASNPHLVRRYFGNIGLTNLQMPGLNSPFTPLPPSLCTVSVALGSITREIRPDQQGHPQQRTLLHLAAAVDHAVVDGIPGAAFYMRFHDLLSSGHGLDDTYLEEFQTRRSTP